MTTYYPVPSEAAGLSLSAALWDMVRPPQNRQPGETTARLYAVVEDAGGQWWLEVPDDHAIMQLSASLTQQQINDAVNEIERLEDMR